eukprot:CAMPEP_0198419760 /NCGR_PEP_ID=MMETSP1452-20131203/423_1 /TAXON_ID=1181717 /ORGANISM="Synchroma pusillum, Strain CCMP3072" /LENGTH=211 /DNA_ID=CAMNT_0044139897 /DNA_START=78 /DNA_END=710 /DNA_ORIENTATION=-
MTRNGGLAGGLQVRARAGVVGRAVRPRGRRAGIVGVRAPRDGAGAGDVVEVPQHVVPVQDEHGSERAQRQELQRRKRGDRAHGGLVVARVPRNVLIGLVALRQLSPEDGRLQADEHEHEGEANEEAHAEWGGPLVDDLVGGNHKASKSSPVNTTLKPSFAVSATTSELMKNARVHTAITRMLRFNSFLWSRPWRFRPSASMATAREGQHAR